MTSPKVLFLCLAAILITLLSGCDAGQSSEGEEARPDETVMNLEDTTWQLVELNGEAVSVAGPIKVPTILFESETLTVSGNSGVNQFGGNYTLTDDGIEFGPMRSTMMAGPPEAMERETTFLQVLGALTSWQIEGDRLQFFDSGAVIAVFVVQAAEEAKVMGTVSYREKMILRPGAVLEVTLEDVSLADVPSIRIAEYRKVNPGTPPFAFELTYDPSQIDERHSYNVRARILFGDQLRFTSDTAHHVITRGQPNEVDIVVVGVSAPQSSP